MKVLLELPDVLKVDKRYLQEALIAVLYTQKKLSEYQACQVLNMTRRDFQEMLPRYGFSILVDTQENLNIELNGEQVSFVRT